jgi:hypothetical protein
MSKKLQSYLAMLALSEHEIEERDKERRKMPRTITIKPRHGKRFKKKGWIDMVHTYILIDAAEYKLRDTKIILESLDMDVQEVFGEFNFICKKDFNDNVEITDFVVRLRKTPGICGVKVLEVIGKW